MVRACVLSPVRYNLPTLSVHVDYILDAMQREKLLYLTHPVLAMTVSIAAEVLSAICFAIHVDRF